MSSNHKRKPSLDNFEQALFDVWQTAPVVIKLPSKNACWHLRARLYSLRMALGASDRPNYYSLYIRIAKMKISINDKSAEPNPPHERWYMSIYEIDKTFTQAILNAGVVITEPPALEETKSPPLPEPPPLEDLTGEVR